MKYYRTSADWKTLLVKAFPLALLFVLGLTNLSWGEPLSLPNISLSIGGKADQPDKVATVIQLLFLLTVLSLAPAILLMLTSFTRIVVVLSLLRQAIGSQQMPSNQIIIGLSLFLTFFVMSPVWQNISTQAIKPYYDEEISGDQAVEKAIVPIKAFMLKQTREKDIALFVKISKAKRPERPDDLSLSVLVPAFVISELKTAFQIGFLLFLPFIIIDMVVASVLLSMGMMMLPPIMMSLPFKLLLFVLVDGWYLIIGSLVQSFH
ncbi:MAG: Flagellar biosynthetic protein FliP precursor [Syntrophus sp. PtaU1.Bin005]|jgi:flagellar biosynthetic protein FliP|uniref:flagellar type III secretion system pore protein FliP n=1 Tax=Syntrophus sp. (in: bacteria) TaxID=48412 RepID=UPI0009D197F0|nr:MAG: Flagellar biosynthetic protein FliP precursor [Syntrophus sp. PtaB.Bin138]OPY83206.1 MAG: Flagellar biosynthetic protein FliP precursor [Syntrophus sp. PtaU1.Bin005]